MPAAAVTPASEAYIKVVAVKKLVVGSGSHNYIPLFQACTVLTSGTCVGVVVVQPFCRVCILRVLAGSFGLAGTLPGAFNRVSGADGTFTLNKFECSKQAIVPENSCME